MRPIYSPSPKATDSAMKPVIAFALSLVAGAVLHGYARAEAAYPVNPGYWEAQTSFMGLTSNTDRWCIQPKDISKFLAGPSNHIYHCTYPINTAANGQLHFNGSCVDKKGMEIKLRGDGQYTPTTLHMNATGSTEFLGLPISGDATADARFISADCPADAKAFK
jgi:hypothetical protein